MYKMERYTPFARFQAQYGEIYQFLLEQADTGYNEHFHWGRFEWMMLHTMLEEEKLGEVTLFREESGRIAGLSTFDTLYQDRTYLLHNGDSGLARQMVDQVLESDGAEAAFKVNSGDKVLQELLRENGFSQKHKEDDVLQIALGQELPYTLPEGIQVSPKNFRLDRLQYQMVIHKGFNHTGPLETWGDQVFEPSPHGREELRVFLLEGREYCAHCGVWYTEGDTAYIEPVVTIPRCRMQGLGRAAVYEALNRARALGAKRAVVLSSQEFYHRIGFRPSSSFFLWRR